MPTTKLGVFGKGRKMQSLIFDRPPIEVSLFMNLIGQGRSARYPAIMNPKIGSSGLDVIGGDDDETLLTRTLNI